jgi:hypothetical protein
MHRISAALACLAVVVTAGCGTAQTTTPRHPMPLPCPRANNVITQADSGKTYCVRVGDQVTIHLAQYPEEPVARAAGLRQRA